jgi:2-aminoadipate transaminase
MLKALDQHMPDEATWSEPSGGMFLWLKLPERIDTKEIFKTAVEHQIAYVIGHPFHCDESGKNTMRLNFSYPMLEQIEVGIKRLAGMIREVLSK